MHRVVIVGGGFAGLECAKALKQDDVDVVLVNRRNFHLFQPLLYQVASGGLSPGDIAAPLRTVLRRAANTKVILGDVTDVDVTERQVVVRTPDGEGRLPYDTLVVATGARHSYFGNDSWEAFAPGLKTIEDATEIRARILGAFERAELEHEPRARQAWLTFIIVGGGPTGVELAGTLADLAQHTMKGEFRAIRSEDAKILLLEGGPRLLNAYDERLGRHAVEALQHLGVAVLTNAKVVRIDADGVDVETTQGPERMHSRTVLWAAGVQASPLGRVLHERTGAVLDRAGRVSVESNLTIKGRAEIFVLGDLASVAQPSGALVPGIAPAAMQMGRYAARVVRERIRGRASPRFHYIDKGSMAVIGRSEAVAQLGFVHWGLTGFIAWLAWLLVHIAFLVGFENKILVLIQWANHYFTRNRGARLISQPESYGPRVGPPLLK